MARKKVSAALRERLLGQKSKMSSGVIIDNKKLTKARLRILPVQEDEVPGREYISFYCESLDGDTKGTTSPAAFGFSCPILDAIDRIRMTGDKEDKEFAWNFVSVNREYWMGVIDRAMPGTAQKPNVRIFKAKKRLYEQIIDYMIDEDDGEDITDPKTGRDIRVRRKGAGKTTEWTMKFLDAEPLSDDAEFSEVVQALAASLNVGGYFFAVDWDILEAIYRGLTGEDSIPEEYNEAREATSRATDDSGESEEDADADEDADKGEAGGDAEAGEEAGEDGAAEIEVGMTVEFEFENDKLQGALTAIGEDEDGDTCYDVDVDGDVYTVYAVTPVEEPEPETEAEEPDEVPPTKGRKTATKKPKKSSPPAAKGKGKSKSNGKVPRKPKASSKIRSRLAGQKRGA